MKQISVLIMVIAPVGAFAVAPSTSCPSGYVAIEAEHMTITNSSCPDGYTSAGYAYGCLSSSPYGSCIMYAPANTQYTDESGTYEFEQACPLE